MDRKTRNQFDRLLEEVLAALPQDVASVLDEVPLIVEDVPSSEMRQELQEEFPHDADGDVVGLHEGVPLTERSVISDVEMPSRILIFRQPLIDETVRPDGRLDLSELREQIRITLLHEIGHHFGFDEDDLEERGYG